MPKRQYRQFTFKQSASKKRNKANAYSHSSHVSPSVSHPFLQNTLPVKTNATDYIDQIGIFLIDLC